MSTPTVTQHVSNFIGGVKHMPVKFAPGKRRLAAA